MFNIWSCCICMCNWDLFLFFCLWKKLVVIDIIYIFVKSVWLVVYMYIYFVWKIVVLKMLDSLERIYRSGYLLIVIDICVYVFIKRSCYIDMGRYCVCGFFLVFYW